MKRLEIKIEPDLLEVFPEVMVGGFLVNGLARAAEQIGEVTKQMDEAGAELLRQGLNNQNLVEDPRIAGWRSAFTRMGLKASTFKGSAEQLARRLLKGDKIATPLPIVNAYCAVSAKNLAPIGGYDMERLSEPEVALRFARPDEDIFTPLAGRREDMPVTPNVAVYGCGKEIICWAFNHRDSRATCLEPETDFAVFFSEGVTASQHAWVGKALEELRQLLSNSGAAVGPIQFINHSVTRAALSL